MSSELTLNILAAEINTLNDSIESSMGQTLRYAVLIGQKLNEAKESVNHGEWTNWLSVNCKVSERHAQRYMKLAKERPELANATHVSDLSLRVAFDLLSAPEEVKNQANEILESGDSLISKKIQELIRQNKELEAESKRKDDKIIQLTNIPKQDLSEYEKTIDELNTQIESLETKYKRQIDSIKTDHKELWDEKIKQAVRMAEEHDKRVKGLEKALKEARGNEAINAAKKSLEDEILAGKNQQIAALEERIKKHNAVIANLETKSAELSNRYGIEVSSAETLKKVNDLLLSISIEISAFQLDFEESPDSLSNEQLDQWRKFQTQYSNGITAIDSIVGGFYLTQDGV